MDFILASSSPRRREILSLAGYDFKVIPSNVDETITEGKTPDDMVMKLALRKAEATAALYPNDTNTIVSADTIVFCGGQLLGKPKDEEDAFNMLRMLSSRTHRVYTGVCIYNGPEKFLTFSEKTSVMFNYITDDEIRAYIKTGEPMDKAGAYAIQGKGCVFVKGVRGDYYNVVGFPVSRFYLEYSEFKASKKYN